VRGLAWSWVLGLAVVAEFVVDDVFDEDPGDPGLGASGMDADLGSFGVVGPEADAAEYAIAGASGPADARERSLGEVPAMELGEAGTEVEVVADAGLPFPISGERGLLGDQEPGQLPDEVDHLQVGIEVQAGQPREGFPDPRLGDQPGVGGDVAQAPGVLLDHQQPAAVVVEVEDSATAGEGGGKRGGRGGQVGIRLGLAADGEEVGSHTEEVPAEASATIAPPCPRVGEQRGPGFAVVAEGRCRDEGRSRAPAVPGDDVVTGPPAPQPARDRGEFGGEEFRAHRSE